MENVSNTSNEEQMKKSYRIGLMRFFSVDSDINLNYDVPTFPKSVCGTKLILKGIQFVISSVGIGFYSEGRKVINNSITSLTYPYIVYGSFIIITGIIILSYMLGYAMPDVLVRIFNTLATILFLISAVLTLYIWIVKNSKPEKEKEILNIKIPLMFLLSQSILSFLNSFVYGLDAFISYRKAVDLNEINNE